MIKMLCFLHTARTSSLRCFEAEHPEGLQPTGFVLI